MSEGEVAKSRSSNETTEAQGAAEGGNGHGGRALGSDVGAGVPVGDGSSGCHQQR